MNEGLVILFLAAIDAEELLGRVNVAGAMEVCDCQLEYEESRCYKCTQDGLKSPAEVAEIAATLGVFSGL
jgi:hypothetical protein